MGSLLFDAEEDRAYREDSVPSTTSFSASAWVKLGGTLSAAYRAVFTLRSAAGTVQIGTVETTGDFFVAAGAAVDRDTAADLVTGNWYYFAVSCGGTGATDLKGYVFNASGTRIAYVETTGQSFSSPTLVGFGNSYFVNRLLNGYCGYARVWDVALSESEFATELPRIDVQKTANFNCGFVDSSSGVSPQGARSWTVAGTTEADTPPVSAGGPTPIVMTWAL